MDDKYADISSGRVRRTLSVLESTAKQYGIVLNPDPEEVLLIAARMLEDLSIFGFILCPNRAYIGNEGDIDNLMCPRGDCLVDIESCGRCKVGLFFKAEGGEEDKSPEV